MTSQITKILTTKRIELLLVVDFDDEVGVVDDGRVARKVVEGDDELRELVARDCRLLRLAAL